jgi:hypothetical protein
MQESLAQIFNVTAAAAYKAFPQELDNLVVLLAPTAETPVYVSPGIADQLTKNIAAVKEAVAERAELMRIHNASGIAHKYYPLAGTVVKMIALNENVRGLFSPRYTKEMRAILVLDHEIGHLAVKTGHTSNGHLNECSADAYATLRHIQRFGKNTDQAKAHGDRNARSIVLFRDAEHYTTDTVQRVRQLSAEMDISGLSLHETADLAEKIADECCLDSETLEKIRIAFLPVNNACLTGMGSRREILGKLYAEDRDAYALFCRETISVMREHRDDPDIFKAGKRFLTSFPAVKKFMQEWAETDPVWKDALNFMDPPQKTLQAIRSVR